MDYTPSTIIWVKLPLELLKRNGISRKAAIMLSVIIDKCKHGADLSAPISSADLIERSGMSRRTAFRALDELRTLELIEVRRTGRTSVYKLTQGCVELCPRAVKDDSADKQEQKQPKRYQKRKPSSETGICTNRTDWGAFLREQERKFMDAYSEEAET